MIFLTFIINLLDFKNQFANIITIGCAVAIGKSKLKGINMIVQNNLVMAEKLQLIATPESLRKSGAVLLKIGNFNSQEKNALESVNFDFDALESAKQKYAEAKAESDLEIVKQLAPKFLYLKQLKNPDHCLVAFAVDGGIYLNTNVDNKLGVGAEATRLKFMGLINGFIKTFGSSDYDVQFWSGEDFICSQSALDDRRTKTAKKDSDCLDW